MSLRIVNWNVQFATPRSWRTPEILGRIDWHEPEIVCLTETHEELLARGGYAICSRADYGYGLQKNRRKVLLWSKEPWHQVDNLGIESLPPGRFVSGVTKTSVGEVAVIGVCIPWFGSRTEARRGAERRGQWEDHEAYLAGLSEVLERVDARRLIVMGDFNQAIGQGSRAPRALRLALQEAFSPKLRIVTADLVFQGRKSIDHIALSVGWSVETLVAISNIHGERNLSDHFGVAADVSIRPASDPMDSDYE